MRIGIEAQRLFRTNKHGMEVFALNLLRALQDLISDNEYVVFVRDGEDDQCLQESENMRIVRVPAMSFGDWEQLALPAYALRENTDVLHCTSNTSPFFSPVPVVLTLHDLFFRDAGQKRLERDRLYQSLGNLYRRINVAGTIASVDAVVTVSEWSRSEIVKTYPSAAGKTRVIPHGIDASFFGGPGGGSTRDVTVSYGLPESYVLALWNKDPRKNTPNTMRAFETYRERGGEASLVLLGLKPQERDAALEGTGMSHLASHILAPGFVSAQDLPAVYRGARSLLYATRAEGFGFPVLEAYAAGTPVVTSRGSATEDLAGRNGILADPEDPASIADALETSLRPEFRTEASRRDRRSRAMEFSWNSAARSYALTYNALAGRARPVVRFDHQTLSLTTSTS